MAIVARDGVDEEVRELPDTISRNNTSNRVYYTHSLASGKKNKIKF